MVFEKIKSLLCNMQKNGLHRIQRLPLNIKIKNLTELSRKKILLKNPVKMDSFIVKDLGLDELDCIELQMYIEEEFGNEFSEAFSENFIFFTVGDIVKAVEKGEQPQPHEPQRLQQPIAPLSKTEWKEIIANYTRALKVSAKKMSPTQRLRAISAIQKNIADTTGADIALVNKMYEKYALNDVQKFPKH